MSQPDRNATVTVPYDPAMVQRLSYAIADAAVVSDIETNCPVSGRAADGRAIYDLRPVLDDREQPPEVIDMMQESLSYAFARGLIAPAAGHGMQPITQVTINPRHANQTEATP